MLLSPAASSPIVEAVALVEKFPIVPDERVEELPSVKLVAAVGEGVGESLSAEFPFAVGAVVEVSPVARGETLEK